MGADVSREPPHAIARRGLGWVPEDRRVFGDLSVLDNLAVGRQPLSHVTANEPRPSGDEDFHALGRRVRVFTDRDGARCTGRARA